MINEDKIVQISKEDKCDVVKQAETIVVLEGARYFWKIVRIDENDPASHFDITVRQAFAQAYRNMGLDWEVFCENIDDELYVIERRQKLKTCESESLTVEQCLQRSANIIQVIEESLELRLLLAQIRSNRDFRNIRQIMLARQHIDAPDDFAIYQDNVLILGDSGWFLALINSQGEWENAIFSEVVDVSLTYGDFYFASQGAFDNSDQAISSIYEVTQNWWLFPKDGKRVIETRTYLKKELENMLRTNSKIVSTKANVEVKDENSYTSFKRECANMLRRGIKDE